MFILITLMIIYYKTIQALSPLTTVFMKPYILCKLLVKQCKGQYLLKKFSMLFKELFT